MSALATDGNHAVTQITITPCSGRDGRSVLLQCLAWSGWIKMVQVGSLLNCKQ